MCIRDRVPSLYAEYLRASRTEMYTSERTKSPELKYLPTTAILVTDLVVFERSVSYTHLRAHETVLDLVCRLLLEKKKKNTHIILYLFNT